MLHHKRAWVLLLLVAGSGAAPAQDRLRGVLTETDRATLEALIGPAVLEVRRKDASPPGFVRPGGDVLLARGWVAAKDRVVTASKVVEGWPRRPEDRIEVRDPQGRWREAAVGLMDARLGWAVLDVSLPAAGEAQPPSKDQIWAGRRLYTAASPPAPVVIMGRGVGSLAWYWRATGPGLLPGAPLFDARGRLVTLVGLARAGGEALVLPEAAFSDLYARRMDWLP